MARIHIAISPDGLEARVTVRPGPATEAAVLDQALRRAGVVFGIDELVREQLVQQLAQPDYSAENLVVARGLAPVKGRDGQLHLAFEPALSPGKLRGDGSLDYLERGLFQPVRQGDVLALYHPPWPGVPGQSVQGKSLEATPGEETCPTLGPAMTMDEDGHLVTQRDGVIHYVAQSTLDVVEQSEHQGDVDHRSGNLRANGSLHVAGTIQPRLTVEVAGDLQIKGDVHQGHVVAQGNVLIGGGVIGAGASLKADGDAVVGYCHGASLQSALRLEIAGDAVNSTCSGQDVKIQGSLVGGTASAERQLVVAKAGSQGKVATELAAGSPLSIAVDKARNAATRARDQRFAGRRHFRGQSTRGRGKRGKSARLAASSANNRVQELCQRQQRIQELLPLAAIEVEELHAGTTVRLGSLTYAVEEHMERVRFSVSNHPVRIHVEFKK
jgi:uncharacterized protein (DUF342 family)